MFLAINSRASFSVTDHKSLRRLWDRHKNTSACFFIGSITVTEGLTDSQFRRLPIELRNRVVLETEKSQSVEVSE